MSLFIENGINIIVSIFLFAVLFAYGYYYFVFKKKKKDKEIYDVDWKKYREAIDLKNMEGIDEYGNNVLWNYYLKPEDLGMMIKDLVGLPKGNLEIETLKKNCVNKSLDLNISNCNRPFASQQ